MVLLDKNLRIPNASGGDLLTTLLHGGMDRPLEAGVDSSCQSATHVLTYATHDAGMFREFVNNEHCASVTVLGWKQPWKDYRDRWGAYREEILRCGQMEDVFILADAFDVRIVQPLEKAREAFDALGARLVVSEAAWQNIVGRRMYLATSRAELPFPCGRSDDSLIACAGLVMGYGRDVVRLATIVSESKCRDDQRTLNTVLPFLDGAVIDKDHKIFCTLKSHAMPAPPGVTFVHYPGVFGQLTLGRILRSVQEYSQHFIGEVAAIFLVATFLLLLWQQLHPFRADESSFAAKSFHHGGVPMATYVSGFGCFLVLIYFAFCNKS